MRRREFITLLGGAAVAGLLRAAQQAGRPPTIGYLGGGTPTAQRAWLEAFVQRLRELGWIEGRTVTIEKRWGEGRPELYAEIAAEFVRLKVDVILAGGTEAAVAAKQATSVIPIVFPTAGDPVGSRWSIPWRGRAATSPACRTWEPISLPSASSSCARFFRVCVGRRSWPMPTIPAASPRGPRSMRQRARRPRARLIADPTRGGYRARFRGAQGPRGSVLCDGDLLVNAQRIRINTFALVARLPTMFSQREYVVAGGLMSYGSNFLDLNRRAADYVDKILRGAKPADLPVEQPTKFDLVVNLVTARALGVVVSPTVLARADEVIE